MLRRAAALAVALSSAAPAAAEVGECRVVDVQLQPQKRTDLRLGHQHMPQIVVWVEDTAGTFIDTVYITQKTGTFGIGNRPGRFDFNSAPLWPYGRRITTFPVWADKKPERWDSIVFQDGADNNLSHRLDQSSLETHFCRPMLADSDATYDAMTCASSKSYTDKGKRSATQSKYPPRQDMVRTPNIDSPDVDDYPQMNPYDAVSAATPPAGQLATITWPILDRPDGQYVLWVEVATEFDHNTTYTPEAYPSPDVSYGEYGRPYRGQPSLVWKVPFTISSNEDMQQVVTYQGYGDPTGADGVIRAPDATITTDLAGSGLQRLALVTDERGEFRVRVTARPELDFIAPAEPQDLAVSASSARSTTLTFIAPGDDGLVGTVRGYEVKYRVGSELTAENWDAPDTMTVPHSITPVEAGQPQELTLDGLLPATSYSVGIRAFDDCRSTGPLSTIAFETTDRDVGEVDACFIATAAYGSVIAADVTRLRNVRDGVLRKSVLGELVVQAYYTFGPPVAGVIGESDLLRWTARSVLAPMIEFVRQLPLVGR